MHLRVVKVAVARALRKEHCRTRSGGLSQPSPNCCDLEGAGCPLEKPGQGREECFVRRRLHDGVVRGMLGSHLE